MGEVSSIVSLTKQQIAVYKMAQKPTPQNKVLEKAEIPFREQTELYFPDTHPFVEQKSSEAFPVKSVVVNPKLLIEALRQFSQSDGMMGGVTIHVGKHDEPILIKSSPNYAWDGNEIVAGVAPIRSNDA